MFEPKFDMNEFPGKQREGEKAKKKTKDTSNLHNENTILGEVKASL